jgi:hypothetical protein
MESSRSVMQQGWERLIEYGVCNLIFEGGSLIIRKVSSMARH